MQFTVNRKELEYATARITNVIPAKAIKPILSGVHLFVREGKVFLQATDMEISIQVELQNTLVEGEFATVVDARTLDEIAKNSLADQVRCELEGNVLKIHTGKGFLHLPTMPAEDFPDVNFMDIGQAIVLPSEILQQMVERVIFSASPDEFMRNLNGMFWEFSGTLLRLVCADGFRLALAEEDILEESETGLDEGKQFLISLKAMKEIVHFLRENQEDTFSLLYDGKRIGFQTEKVQFVSRLLEINFPDYRRVLPSGFKTKLIADRERLLKHLKFVQIITRASGESVRLEIRDNTLRIIARSIDKGDADIPFEVEQEGKDLTIAFNPRFLIEGLQHLKGEKVEIGLVDANSPLQMNEMDIKGFLHIVMPVRMG
ncbi:MAG TPA: DNA polymerase III subunit beta [Thermotogota bacterium]|nr:DNA polymerase III subunit beta [Thermotogota bacterium]HRW92413.1 DNA polymerase III subunit beta [Thermotogota bacterium]